MWMVYQAVDQDSLDKLIGLHPQPYAQCPVGSKMYALLDKPYAKVKGAVEEAMGAVTLQQLLEDYAAM